MEEGGDTVKLVWGHRLKKAAHISDRRCIPGRFQHDAQTPQVHVIRGRPEHAPQQSDSVTRRNIRRDGGLPVDDDLLRRVTESTQDPKRTY